MTDRSANWTLSDEEDDLSNDDEKGPNSKKICESDSSDQESDSSDQESDSSDYYEDSSSKKVRFDLGEDAYDEESEEVLEDKEFEGDEEPEELPKEETKPVAYVSPHRRKYDDMKLEQLMRRVQGLINRLVCDHECCFYPL